MKPYLLFDAGGTLLFPNAVTLHETLREFGGTASVAEYDAMMSVFVHLLDMAIRDASETEVRFYEWLVERAGVEAALVPQAADRLRQKDEEQSLWNAVRPGTIETLAALRQEGYSMSVISNAFGHVEEDLAKAGLGEYLERVFDSHLVGFTKPDVRLFRHALQELQLDAGDCVYVGDFFQVDVLGANGAGIAAIHLDPEGLYEGWPGCHIPSVNELPPLLRSGLHLTDALYHPFA